MFRQTLVIERAADERLVALRASRARRIEEAGADAVAEAVECAFFDGHAARGEADVRVVAAAEEARFVFVGLLSGGVDERVCQCRHAGEWW